MPLSNIEILHKDDALLVINKPTLLLSVPGRAEDNRDCLITRLQENGYPEARIVHRLDWETSGLIVLARTRLVGHNDDVPPHLTADLLEFLNIHQSTSSISDPAPPLLTMPQYFIIFIIAAFCRVVNLSCAKFVKRVANGTQSTRISMPAGTAP